ncbi:SDR family NAD(P)-dependent oxidoreductase [Streptomyces brevispora]|uniref:2-hydroxycyclohexanecarboxyl-CoA dehydrogenase n=1 Tax=Streptomyces brevispora TaxID=887462 RepID=A0A561UUD0_9ACTN|nr:SDR family NAD(P)-dependent oxidoreductase [Streptomyces brevispora]TWG02957.1 2-hydroxycyclohexanecarboxyl-CoA dehydrogenase [Streptomyces brevispora]WSC15948.1 SDR family oxidoreductase [Streptomyces brevispora]
MNTRAPGRYTGRVAVVTGAASGIGRAVVDGLVAEGALVVANDVSAGPLGELASDRVVTVTADVREPHAAQQLVGAARDLADGRIDALFNNAGISRPGRAAEIDEETWSHVMGVNNDAAFHVVTAVGRVMIEQGHGAVLNTASVAGTHGLPGNVPYVVSKHAVVGLTRALAVEWGVHGIRVNALCPGLTASGMNTRLRAADSGYWEAREAVVPLRRAGTAEEQASVALFLNSPEASYVSGLIAEVDGGTHALYAGYAVNRPV